MKAGQSKIDVGARIKIKGIRGEDSFLNGLVGSVTHPFAFGETKKGWVGVWLDAGNSNTSYGGQVNIKETECDLI